MTWYSANFGSNKAGLANVGYREYDNAGADAVARTQVGVVDAGDGMYGVDVVLNASTVGLQWDTGEAVPVFANEDVNQLAALDAKVDIIDANVDLILIDTTQILLDVAAGNAQGVLILADTTQLLLDIAAVNAQNVLILADTTQLLLDTIAILSDTAAILLNSTNIDLLLSDIEGGRDIREILRLIVASANNILSGAEAGSTQITLKSLDGLKDRQVTTVDVDGNRLAIVSRDFTT